jgi:tetratricopeptide (TPR) repeat protein
VALASAADDPVPRCEAPNDRGIVAIYQSRHEDAETYFRQAHDAFLADDNRPGIAGALCNISRAHAAMGRTDSAIDLASRGVEMLSSLGLTLRVANGRYALGLAFHQAGRLAEALTQLSEALCLFRDNRQRLWEGSAHARLAEVHLAGGRHAEAATHAEQALALKVVGGEWHRGTVLTVLGKALASLGQTDRARACWGKAQSIFEELGVPEEAEVRDLLAPTVAV